MVLEEWESIANALIVPSYTCPLTACSATYMEVLLTSVVWGKS